MDMPEAPQIRFASTDDVIAPVEEPQAALDLRCPWCYKFHQGAECPWIVEIEFHESGALKRAVLAGPRTHLQEASLDELPG
jgi:hypothetical protein